MALMPINRDPERLCPCVRRRYEALLAQCYSKDIQLVLIETIRTVERQRYYLNKGVSKTMNSYHLPQVPNMLSLAFDVCPHEYLAYPRWNSDGEKWSTTVDLAVALGLSSGFKEWGWDKPHFHLRRCACEH
jgi:peptidoglycan L-alanyl-D-glutamate endopeptidase CwlK